MPFLATNESRNHADFGCSWLPTEVFSSDFLGSQNWCFLCFRKLVDESSGCPCCATSWSGRRTRRRACPKGIRSTETTAEDGTNRGAQRPSVSVEEWPGTMLGIATFCVRRALVLAGGGNEKQAFADWSGGRDTLAPSGWKSRVFGGVLWKKAVSSGQLLASFGRLENASRGAAFRLSAATAHVTWHTGHLPVFAPCQWRSKCRAPGSCCPPVLP